MPELTAAENIFLGRERGRPAAAARRDEPAAQQQLDELGAQVSAGALARSLSVAQQQMVEIARALMGESKVLILDEPSATLSRTGGGAAVRGAAQAARARPRHRLRLAPARGDLRDRRPGHACCATAATSRSSSLEGVDRAQLIRWMVGRDLSEEFPARVAAPGAMVLEVEGLVLPAGFFSDVSLSVAAGRDRRTGRARGRRPHVRSRWRCSARSPARGEIRLDGAPVRFRSPAEAIEAGLGYVTEDRKGRGLFPLLGAGENIADHVPALVHARGPALPVARQRAAAAKAAKDFDLRAASLEQRAGTLSGGNQQKLLLARYLLRPRRLLILDEPTRGIDVGAKAEIYALMNRLTAEGLAILMISSELPEVLAMSDRVVVMHEGRTARRADASGGHRGARDGAGHRADGVRHESASPLALELRDLRRAARRVRCSSASRPTRSSRPATSRTSCARTPSPRSWPRA